MSKEPYAIAVCRSADVVLLSNGECASFTDWLGADLSPVYPTGPETPNDARFIGYELHGRICATDIEIVQAVSLH